MEMQYIEISKNPYRHTELSSVHGLVFPVPQYLLNLTDLDCKDGQGEGIEHSQGHFYLLKTFKS